LLLLSRQPEETQSTKEVIQPETIIQGPSPLHKPAAVKVPEKERSHNRRSKGKKDVPK
jgi:hypothetical protein